MTARPSREPTDEELQLMRRQVIDWIQRQEAADAAKRTAARAPVSSRRGKLAAAVKESAPAPVPPAQPPAPPLSAVEKPKPTRRARVHSTPLISQQSSTPQVQPPSPAPAPKASRPPAAPPPSSPSWPRVQPGPKSKTKPAAGYRRRLRRIAVTALSAFVLGIVVGPAISIYGFGATGAWVGVASRLVPFPAAYVNTRLIRYADFLDDYAALRTYQRGTTVDAAGLREQVLQKLIADALVEQLAHERQVEVDPRAVPRYVDGLAAELGGHPVLEQRLQQDFHLNRAMFIRRVVQPHLLREALVATLSQRPEVREAALDNAETLRQQIASGELEFSLAASRYSQDLSARVGGDLGYLAVDGLAASLGQADGTMVGDLALDTVSPVVESPNALSLYRVTERLAGEGDGPARLRVWRIVLRPQVSIEAVVHDAAARARIIRFVR